MTDKLGNCIAFYDVDPSSFKTENWYNFILDWFKEYHQIPTRMGLIGKYVNPSTQTKTFKHYDKVIREIEFQKITSLWVGSTPQERRDDYSDAVFGASFSFITKGKDSVLTFDDAVIPFTHKAVEALVIRATKYFMSAYAIAFQRHLKKGPLYYAQGMILNGGYTEQEEDYIARWFHRYGDPEEYEVGDLRDIYPMNFISYAHLRRPVGNMQLKNWIHSSPQHGRLRPLTDVLWSWIVGPDDIPTVREELKKANLLVVYRDFKEPRAPTWSATF